MFQIAPAPLRRKSHRLTKPHPINSCGIKPVCQTLRNPSIRRTISLPKALGSSTQEHFSVAMVRLRRNCRPQNGAVLVMLGRMVEALTDDLAAAADAARLATDCSAAVGRALAASFRFLKPVWSWCCIASVRKSRRDWRDFVLCDCWTDRKPVLKTITAQGSSRQQFCGWARQLAAPNR